jgi:hypothetical protein
MCCKLRLSNRFESYLSQKLEVLVKAMKRCFQLIMLVMGPLMFVTANVLIVIVVWILLFESTPFLREKSLVLYFCNVAFIIWGTGNILFNYWACALTAPGSPDCSTGDSYAVNSPTKDRQRKPSYQITVASGVVYKYCQKCNCVKPPRAHHCR